MTHLELVQKIEAIRPGAIWTLTDTAYENLIWQDTVQPKPTAAELGL